MDESAVQKVASEDGTLISKEDFIKICQDQKLLDFGGPMGEKRKTAIATPRKEKRLGESEADNVSFSFFIQVFHVINILCVPMSQMDTFDLLAPLGAEI